MHAPILLSVHVYFFNIDNIELDPIVDNWVNSTHFQGIFTLWKFLFMPPVEPVLQTEKDKYKDGL